MDRFRFGVKKRRISENPGIFQESPQRLGETPWRSFGGPWIPNHGFPVRNSSILGTSKFSKIYRKVVGNHGLLRFPEPLDLRSRGPVGIICLPPSDS